MSRRRRVKQSSLSSSCSKIVSSGGGHSASPIFLHRIAMPPPVSALRNALVLIAIASGIGDVVARQFVPTTDATVVETLRDQPLGAADNDFRRLRAQLRVRPADLNLALAVAQRAIEIARRDGDPRFLGYAQAALTPWWSLADPPPSVRVMKAVLLQSTHAFAPALAELDAVLRMSPNNAQAWLIRVAILQVQGKYADATHACDQLRTAGAVLYASVCRAELTGLTGDNASARTQLAQLIAATAAGGSSSPALSSWLALIEAEMAERDGDALAADRHYRLALKGAGDAYAKAAYADFLLDQNRSREVIKLLERDQRADALLLRLAIAYQREKDDRLTAAAASLKARFDAARLRGDTVHQREEARFNLQLLAQPAAALSLAKQNWATQKESGDTRILLEAARAAGDQATIAAARDFIRANRIVDRRLTPLLAE